MFLILNLCFYCLNLITVDEAHLNAEIRDIETSIRSVGRTGTGVDDAINAVVRSASTSSASSNASNSNDGRKRPYNRRQKASETIQHSNRIQDEKATISFNHPLGNGYFVRVHTYEGIEYLSIRRFWKDIPQGGVTMKSTILSKLLLGIGAARRHVQNHRGTFNKRYDIINLNRIISASND